MDGLDAQAGELLRRLTGDPRASFRDGQLEAVRAVVADRRRVLVVQRTGWGKSAVYFIATRLLRDQGNGPTLLVSPLLALMRDQIRAAQRIVRAGTINSTNRDKWASVVADVEADAIDVVLISPERLASREFRETVLDRLGSRAGLVVIDEAHCISDWGHDFRPDYRRIRRVLELLPHGVPVMACTATANDRVVDDVVRQLGGNLAVFRGPLARGRLALQVIDLETPVARLAWLARTIPQLVGSGVVYCLTVRDADTVAEWLRRHHIRAESYSSATDEREQVEQALLTNDVDVVVATSALGMGFDKPDLAFVIHYQSPGSVVAYYQQVGRAGRQLRESVGVLLRGREDRAIQDWFIESAFPTAAEALEVIATLEQHDGYMKLAEIEASVNVKQSRIKMLMKNLEVDGFVMSDGLKYARTARPFVYDAEHAEAITRLRRIEQQQMLEYGTSSAGCRMAFLGHALDDPDPRPCGICDLCAGPFLSSDFDPAVAAEAARFLRQRPIVIEPRKKWPDHKSISVELRNSEGRALCRWGDGGWSELVKRGKQVDGHFERRLVKALTELFRSWQPNPEPAWITWVPSLRHPVLVAQLAADLGEALGLPTVQAVVKTKPTPPQKTMQNSAQQVANINGAFAVTGPPSSDPVLLVDDVVDSRWTLTYVGTLLRGAGVEAVVPVALADSGSS